MRAPIKHKGGEVFVLDWQNDESRIKDFVADQYIWVADTTKSSNHSGITLVKNAITFMTMTLGLHMQRKMPHSKEFRKPVSFIKSNPFLQVVEYIGNGQAYKPVPHGSSKVKTGEYCCTALSVLKEISKTLTAGASVSNTYTKLVRDCNEPNMQGVMNPRNREQVKICKSE